MLTTILGQLVSVTLGRTLTDELMKAAGSSARHPKTSETIHDDDAFPGTDYVLKQELKRHPEVDMNRVCPWRATLTIVSLKKMPLDKPETSCHRQPK